MKGRLLVYELSRPLFLKYSTYIKKKIGIYNVNYYTQHLAYDCMSRMPRYYPIKQINTVFL